MRASTDLTAVAPPRDGVTLTGPRAVRLEVEIADLNPEDRFWLKAAESVSYEIEMDVLHAAKPLRVAVTLPPEADPYPDTDPDSLKHEYQQDIGRWGFNHPGLWSNG